MSEVYKQISKRNSFGVKFGLGGNETVWNETEPASGEIVLPPAGSHSHWYL